MNNQPLEFLVGANAFEVLAFILLVMAYGFLVFALTVKAVETVFNLLAKFFEAINKRF